MKKFHQREYFHILDLQSILVLDETQKDFRLYICHFMYLCFVECTIQIQEKIKNNQTLQQNVFII